MNRLFLICAAAGLAILTVALVRTRTKNDGPAVSTNVSSEPGVAGITFSQGEDPEPNAKTMVKSPDSDVTTPGLEDLAKLQEALDSESAEPLLAQLRQWAANDPAACSAWCQKNLEGTARLRAVAEVIGTWLATKPEEALAWLAEHHGEPGNEEATSQGVMHLAQSDPTSAAEWLATYPDAGSLENWEIITNEWSSSDPFAARAYLDANLPSGVRDALLPGLLAAAPPETDYGSLLANDSPEVQTASLSQAADALSHPSPAAALRLAAAIPDAAQRDALRLRIHTEWQERDPAAARSHSAAESAGATPVAR